VPAAGLLEAAQEQSKIAARTSHREAGDSFTENPPGRDSINGIRSREMQLVAGNGNSRTLQAGFLATSKR
jgi:hypothetical protein